MEYKKGSRTRQSPNELPLYLFSSYEVDTNGHIETKWNETPHVFMAENLGTTTKDEIDVLSGRVLQSRTITRYKTSNQIVLKVGDNISEIPNANELQQSSIVRFPKIKPQTKRGARHNTTRIIEQTFEVS